MSREWNEIMGGMRPASTELRKGSDDILWGRAGTEYPNKNGDH
jgi:hypothetical protein